VASQPGVTDLPVASNQVAVEPAATKQVTVANLPEIRQATVDTTFAELTVDVLPNATVEAINSPATIGPHEIEPVGISNPLIETVIGGEVVPVIGRATPDSSDSSLQNPTTPSVDESDLTFSTSPIDLSLTADPLELDVVDLLESEVGNSDFQFGNYESGPVDPVTTRDVEFDLFGGSGVRFGDSDSVVSDDLILGRSETSSIGSSTIIDDPDQTPTIEPDFDSSSEANDSVVSDTVDIERSLVAANLDLVSRHVVMPARSPLALPLDAAALANVELAAPDEYAPRRAHFSTHAAIASFRRMEIAEFHPVAAKMNVLEMAESRPVDSRQYSQVEGMWESVIERAEVVLPMSEPVVPSVREAELSPVDGVPLSDSATVAPAEHGFDLSNPLVTVPLLVFSCLGGLVVNRNLDPDESRAFEHRL
jgi:hypothetical protein